LRTLDGIKIHASASVKKLELIELRKSLLWERRGQDVGVSEHFSTSLKA